MSWGAFASSHVLQEALVPRGVEHGLAEHSVAQIRRVAVTSPSVQISSSAQIAAVSAASCLCGLNVGKPSANRRASPATRPAIAAVIATSPSGSA